MPKGGPPGREDLDPQAVQASGAGEAVSSGQHHDRVLAAVRHHRHDRDAAAQGEPHEALPAAEVNLVALSPRAAGFQVAARIHHDARPARQSALGVPGARGDRASRRSTARFPAERVADHR